MTRGKIAFSTAFPSSCVAGAADAAGFEGALDDRSRYRPAGCLRARSPFPLRSLSVCRNGLAG